MRASSALTTRERPQRLVEDTVGKREVVRDRGGLRLSRVAAQCLEALGEVGVLAHGAGRGIRVLVAHRERRLVHAQRQRAEAARVEDARAGQHLRISRARILRQIAEFTRPLHLAVRRQDVARQHLGQGRLAGAVAADETDLVARGHAERHV
jgi:hypothetical protein